MKRSPCGRFAIGADGWRVYHRHLVNTVPNNLLTRWIVRLLNRYMTRCDSMWTLRIRYRKPKPGERHGWGGSLRRAQARRFALYLEEKPGSVKNRHAKSRERAYLAEAARDAAARRQAAEAAPVDRTALGIMARQRGPIAEG